MSDTIKLHVIHCGQVQVDIALPFRQRTLNPVAYTGLFRSERHQVLLPVSAYLIEHPKGLVLIDTGWHSNVRNNQIKYLGRLHYMINKAILPEGQAINEQLGKYGIKPQDLDYVVLSHLHSDHASGLKLLNESKKIIVSEEELRAANKDKLRYIHHMWKGTNIKTFHMTLSEYGPQHRSFDLFGDDTIVFVHVPGHTSGLVATIIQNNDKFVLLTSDCGYAPKSWEQMILPGVMVNKKQLFESLSWEKEMSQKANCIRVIANHDPDTKPQTIEI